MKRGLGISLTVAVCMALGACSSTRTLSDIAKEAAKAEKVREEANDARLDRKQERLEAKLKATPKWALEAMRIDGDGVYAVGFGESDQPSVAIKKATLEAEFGLAKKYRQELSGQERISVSDKGERGLSQGYGQLIDSLIASVPMNGHQVLEQEVKAVQGQVSAWVLMKMSHEQMQQMAKRESGAAEDARMSAAFADLERRVRERREDELRAQERRQAMRIKEMGASAEVVREGSAAPAAVAPQAGADGSKAALK